MATAKRPSFELISVDQITKSPRGRKAELDQDLIVGFGMITADDQALVLDGYGSVYLLGLPDDSASRAKVSTVLRKNWNHVPGQTHTCRVDYSVDGVPQIRRGKLITAAE